MCLESFDKLTDNIEYKSYKQRLLSFKNWNGKLKPEILASSGFYFLNREDICMCYYCGAKIFDWQYDDCPVEEHFKYFKKCDLINIM